jgi:hypothetical protein
MTLVVTLVSCKQCKTIIGIIQENNTSSKKALLYRVL